jgi:hypothetical protein
MPAPEDAEIIFVRSLHSRGIVPVINDEPRPSVALTVVEQDRRTGGPGRTFDIILPVEGAMRLIEQLPEDIANATFDADDIDPGHLT